MNKLRHAMAIDKRERSDAPASNIEGSSSPRLVVPDCAGEPPIEAAFREALRGEAGVALYTERASDMKTLIARLGDARTAIHFFSAAPLSAAALRASSLQRVVVAGPVGASVDIEAAKRFGIAVYDTPGLAAPAVAEYTVALMLGVGRGLFASAWSLRTGQWRPTIGRGLAGATVGLIGLGEIGRHVARMCGAFSARVISWSPSLTSQRAADCGAQRVDLDDLMRASDVVSVHLRLGAQNSGLIDARLIGLMRRSAFFINTARAALVDGAALRAALVAHRIAGAALDVFDCEPLPEDSPWLGVDNLVLAPHMAWMSQQAVKGFVEAAVSFALRGDGSRVRRVV
jgi:phosphoglycerate dehydrogenase-like enzyme